MKLSQRLREANEGSRELDLEFHKLLGKCPEDAYFSDHVDGSPPSWGWSVKGKLNVGYVPPYLTSSGGIPAELLAAAEEDGREWSLWKFKGRYTAWLQGQKHLPEVRGATPALALAVAIAEVLEG